MAIRKAPLFGIGIYPEARDPQQAFRLANLAEASEVEFISMVDHPYRAHFLDPWTTLTALGAATQRIRLLTNVICLPLRPPAVLGKAAASLDILTGGRFELGLGAGAFWEEIQAYGGPYLQPAEAFEALDEAIDVIRTIWGQSSSEKASIIDGRGQFTGKYYRLHDVPTGPEPAHDIGIWIGAVGPRMCRLIGRKADGWVVSNIYRPFEQALPLQNSIDEAARRVGRDPSTIARWYNLWGVIKASNFSFVHPTRPHVPVLSVNEWVEQILRYHHELRMDIFCFWNTESDREIQNRLFLEEVVPAVQDALSHETTRGITEPEVLT